MRRLKIAARLVVACIPFVGFVYGFGAGYDSAIEDVRKGMFKP